MNVTYTITKHHAVQILSISNLRDECQNRQILKELDQKINFQSNLLVIDLAQLNLINSIGINFLLSLFRRIKKGSGQFILTNVSRGVRRILDVTKLSNIFVIESTVEQAVNSCSVKLAIA